MTYTTRDKPRVPLADLPGPLSITDYFDALRRDGLEIVPDSLVWLPDPQKPGRWVVALAVRETENARSIRVINEATQPEGVRE